jgi:enoyl-CoA hydratase
MTDYLDAYLTIAGKRDGRVLTLTLNRPGKLNAVDAQMHKELSTIFDAVNLDAAVDLVVLTGAGRAFSAGGDAGWMVDLTDKDGEWQRKAVESRRIWLSLLDLEKPLICRLNGAARGMCATIASLCDVIIAAESATLADTHLNMGLAAADGCHAIWPFVVGFAKTKDLLFNASVLTAADALALGLITQVHPDAELDAAVDRYVAGLLKRPARALQQTKMAVNFQMKQLVWPAIESGLNLLEMSNFSKEKRLLVEKFTASRRKAPRDIIQA